MPVFNLLYFKNLLDEAVISFFDKFNGKFISLNGNFFLSNEVSKYTVFQELKKFIEKRINEIIVDLNILSPQYYIIIGSCFPKDNILLKYKIKDYFPKKLSLMIRKYPNVKYVLKEKDIKIDLLMLNQIADQIFNNFFNEMKSRKLDKNVFFIKNNQLDCYLLFKTIKGIYGNSNCNNLYAQKMMLKDSPLISINDMIGKYTKKNDVKDDISYIRCQQETKFFLKNLIGL